jgi:hypothetical protein
MLTQGPEMFPPDYTMANLNVSWVDPQDDAVLRRQAPANQVGRYMMLFRVWGNRTLDSYTRDGKRWVGGLQDEVFRSFGLSVLSGNDIPEPMGKGGTTTIGVGTNPGSTGDGRAVLKPIAEPPSGGDTAGGKKTSKEPEPVPIPPDPVPGPGISVPNDPRETRFRAIERDIEKWMNGESLASFSTLLTDLLSILDSAIRWEDAGIPAIMVKDYLTSRRIEIEGQTGSVTLSAEHRLVFHREEAFRYALLALAAWREKGNKSWQFAGAEDYVLVLYNWIHQEQQRIIQFVRDPFSTGAEVGDIDEITVAGQVVVTTLSEAFSGSVATVEEVYLQMATLDLKGKVDTTRNDKWQALQRIVSGDGKDLSEHYLRYFNLVQGDIRRGAQSEAFYLHAARILPVLKKLLSDTWSFEQVALPNKPKLRSELLWYRSINLLHDTRNQLPEAIRAEYTKTDQFATHVKRLLGEDIQEVELLFEDMKQMVLWLQEQREIDPTPFTWMLSDACNPTEIVPYLSVLSSIGQLQGIVGQFMSLSKDPILPLQPYQEALAQFHNMIDRLHHTYQQRLTNLGNQSGQTDAVNEETKKALQSLHNELDLMKAGVHHATK